MRGKLVALLFSIWMIAIGAGGVYLAHDAWFNPNRFVTIGAQQYIAIGLMGMTCIAGLVHLLYMIGCFFGESELPSLSCILGVYYKAWQTLRSGWILIPFAVFMALRILGNLISHIEGQVMLRRFYHQALVGPPPFYSGMEFLSRLFLPGANRLAYSILPSAGVHLKNFDGGLFALIFILGSVRLYRGLEGYERDDYCAEGVSFLRKIFVPLVVLLSVSIFLFGFLNYEQLSIMMPPSMRNMQWGYLDLLFQVCNVVLSGFLMGGILGQLLGVREGRHPSLDGFLRDSVRWSKPLTGISLVALLPSLVWFHAEVIADILKYAVVAGLMFAPYSAVVEGCGVKRAFAKSLRFWKENWTNVASLLAAGVSVVLPLSMILIIPYELAFRAYGKNSLELFPAGIPYLLGAMVTGVFFLVAAWELYVSMRPVDVAVKMDGSPSEGG